MLKSSRYLNLSDEVVLSSDVPLEQDSSNYPQVISQGWDSQ